MSEQHVPVLLAETLGGLAIREDGLYIDATFGRGGHSGALLERLGPRGRLLAVDRDPDAIAAGEAQLAGDERVTLRHERFGRLEVVAREVFGETPVDGVLLDLGVSSPQLDTPERGFGFAADGPLDMRMNPHEGVSAARWLATVDERELGAVIRKYGEDRFARRIARAIVAARSLAAIETTSELARVVAAAVPARPVRGRKPKHPATQTFQAIRIHINEELGEVEAVLPQCVRLLRTGGRCAAISFHSLEDRLVKRYFRRAANPDPVFAGLPEIPPDARPTLRLVSKAIRAGEAEIARNPRARSAVLRIAERIE